MYRDLKKTNNGESNGHWGYVRVCMDCATRSSTGWEVRLLVLGLRV